MYPLNYDIVLQKLNSLGYLQSLTSNREQNALLEAVLSKTYISKSLDNGLSREVGNARHFKLTKEQLIQFFVLNILQIHQEYASETSEISYIFSSPSFRVLLEANCGRAHGYYNPSNILCLNLKFTFLHSNNIEDFNHSLRALIRHESHHGSKSILRAPLYKRPDIALPCSYEIDKPYHYDSVFRLDGMQALYPFGNEEKNILINAISSDVNYIVSTMLVNSTRCPLSGDLFDNYQPNIWSVGAHPEKDYGLTANAIQSIIEAQGTYCFAPFNRPVWHNRTLSLCADRIKLEDNNHGLVTLSGFAVKKSTPKYVAFAQDVLWRLHEVEEAYSPYMQLSEKDAWLYEFPYPLYRTFFPNLNRLHQQEFLKFIEIGNRIEHCQDMSNNNLNIEACLQRLCFDDLENITFSDVNGIFRDLYLRVRNRIREGGSSYDRRNLDEIVRETTLKQLKYFFSMDLSHGSFMKSIQPSHIDHRLLNRTYRARFNFHILGHSELNNSEYSPISLDDLSSASLSSSRDIVHSSAASRRVLPMFGSVFQGLSFMLNAINSIPSLLSFQTALKINNEATGSSISVVPKRVIVIAHDHERHIAVAPGVQLNLGTLTSQDHIYMQPNLDQHNGLPTCINTARGAVLTSGATEVTVEESCQSLQARCALKTIQDESFLKAFQEVFRIPLFNSPLYQHGIAALVGLREEIAERVLQIAARGNKSTLAMWNKRLKEIKSHDSIKLFSELGEMSIRLQAPKDISLTEATVHRTKRLLNDEQVSQDDYWTFILAPIQISVPYVDLNGARRFINDSLGAFKAKGATQKLIGILAALEKGLLEMIPGGHMIKTSLNKQGKKITHQKTCLPAFQSSKSRNVQNAQTIPGDLSGLRRRIMSCQSR